MTHVHVSQYDSETSPLDPVQLITSELVHQLSLAYLNVPVLYNSIETLGF